MLTIRPTADFGQSPTPGSHTCRRIKTKCGNRQTTRRSICQPASIMEELLQHIDLDYYRSAQLLIARAEIAELRRQTSALAHTEQQDKIPTEAALPDRRL
jgi:hypothetical protein